MRPLRIGIIAPPWFAVPPTGYGGIEWVVSYLADGLTALGHDVTLFASGGSHTTARLVSTYAEPPSALLGDPIIEARHLVEAYRYCRGFDVIHDHTGIGLIAGAAIATPVVHTVHGEVLPRVADFYQSAAAEVHFISISEHQRSTLPPGLDVTVIHNGIDTALFPYGEGEGGYLLFVGRMSAQKGIVDAVEIARRTDMPLLVLAKVNEAPEWEYFQEVVRPRLAGVEVDFREQISHAEKAEAYRHAAATLFPIHWPEPFGLVMVESMSAGTPVIAFRDGAVPEVIADGVTGFIRTDVEGAVEAVGRLAEIDRKACRSHVQGRFSAEANVRAHEALYLRVSGHAAPAQAVVRAPTANLPPLERTVA
ncbi:MAG: glycosyltransferase family 4 protein [Tepidiformaceae bacterium]